MRAQDAIPHTIDSLRGSSCAFLVMTAVSEQLSGIAKAERELAGAMREAVHQVRAVQGSLGSGYFLGLPSMRLATPRPRAHVPRNPFAHRLCCQRCMISPHSHTALVRDAAGVMIGLWKALVFKVLGFRV